MHNNDDCRNVSVTDEEIQALNLRYEGYREFEELIKRDSFPVIAISSILLYSLLHKDKVYNNLGEMPYKNTYEVCGEENVKDEERKSTDKWLFKECGRHVRYAALSLDSCLGLTSYGDCFFSLDGEQISNRASVLEENSIIFFRKHSLNLNPPRGFRSTWAERHKLVMAKLACKMCHLAVSTTPDINYFSSLLLQDKGSNWEQNEYVEIIICGQFYLDRSIIKEINILLEKTSTDPDAYENYKLRIGVIAELIGAEGIKCTIRK